jgi:hypothetical protein
MKFLFTVRILSFPGGDSLAEKINFYSLLVHFSRKKNVKNPLSEFLPELPKKHFIGKKVFVFLFIAQSDFLFR